MIKKAIIAISIFVLISIIILAVISKPKGISEKRRLNQCQLEYLTKLAEKNNVHAMELLSKHYYLVGDYEKVKSFGVVIHECMLKRDCNETTISEVVGVR